MRLLKLVEAGFSGDFLTLDSYSDESACIEISNPFNGDTMTGIGREAAITLTKQQARDLAAHLMAWAESPR